jgi:hypothetical protein
VEQDRPYASVRDTPSSWQDYRPPAAGSRDELPAGLLLHVAGPTDDGFRVIEVWSSHGAFERHERERRRWPPDAPAPLRPPTVRGLAVERLLLRTLTDVIETREPGCDPSPAPEGRGT